MIFYETKNHAKHAKIFYDISYKTFMASMPLRIRFDKIDGFMKIYNGIRYLVILCNS